MIGIFISIAIIFILVSLSLGLESAIEEQFRQLGSDKFFVEPKGQLGGSGSGLTGAVTLTRDDLRIIEKVNGVKATAYWMIGSAKVEYQDQIRYTIIVGVEAERSNLFVEAGFIKAEDGRLLEKGDSGKTGIGYLYKYGPVFKRPLDVGDTIKVNDEPFKVKSIQAQVGNPIDDKIVYVTEEDFKLLYPEKENTLDQIAVQIMPGRDIKKVAADVQKKLDKHRDVDDKTRDFNILTPEELLETIGSVLGAITGFLLGVAAISLLVGGIGIANTMYTSVLERTKEIGIMKSVGAKNSSILALFTVEAGLLGLVGGVIGIAIGLIFAKAIEYIALNQLQTTILQAATPPSLIIGCLLFSFVIGAVSGLWPAHKASKTIPVDALRYE